MNKILKEPLTHFVLLGTLLFLVYGFLNRNTERPEDYSIYIKDSDIDRLAKAYQKNWGSFPDTATLRNLLKEELQSEIFYREALRMQLDHNDEIIRRRLKQKYEFLIKDLNDQQLPSEEELKEFYKNHPDLYQSRKKIAFNQYYFSPDKRSNPLTDAKKALSDFQNKKTKAIASDPFHLQEYYADRDQEAIRQLFGQDFARGLFQLERIGWAGPIASGYGQHIVEVKSIETAAPLPLEQIKEQVIEDWKQYQLQLFNEQLFQNLEGQYEVIYDLDQWKNQGIE